MARLNYKEIAKRRIKEKRNVVISEAYNKENECIGYSIAEQLIIEEEGTEIKVFLKNGLGIVDSDGLLKLKEAIDEACIALNLVEECECEYDEYYGCSED